MDSPEPERFRARVSTTTVGSAMVTRIRAQYLDATRDGAMLGDPYGDLVQIGFPLMGSTVSEQGGRARRASVGEVTVLDDRRAFAARFTDPAEVVQTYLPRTLMREFGLHPETWAGRKGPLTATGHILQRALVSLTANGSAVARSARAFTGRAIHELAIGMLLEISEADPPVTELRAATNPKAMQYIAEHFADPNLDATSLSSRLGVSRRHLYEAFEGDALGITGRLRQTRLQRGAQMLAAPRSGSVPVATVAAACGFKGADQFTRSFKREYGMTPAVYRTHVREHGHGAIRTPQPIDGVAPS